MNTLPIEINDIATWPVNLISILKEEEDTFKEFINRNNEILELRNTDYLKYSISQNQFLFARETALAKIETELNNSSFVGYHCTRITERELSDISKDGLKVSSKQLYFSRINNLLLDRHISKDFFNTLSSTSVEQYTSNEIWLLCGKEDLKRESGVGDLFKYWGGEALFKSLNSDREKLKTVGKPAIILLALDLIKITNIKYPGKYKVSEAIVNFYLLNQGYESTKIGVEFPINCSVKPENILRIVSREDLEFSLLTEIVSWDRKL